jgi:predicted AlkP superfamily pyrophosphatase or phosphodiesterase
MTFVRLVLCLLLVALLAAWLPASRAASDLRPTVILISLDGWRWDYLSRFPAPNLRRLAARGVRAEGLIPSFPSKTFPNHYTLVTGLYPGHHGMIANNVYDAPTRRWFTMSNRKEVQDPMWWGGEPIWIALAGAGQLSAPLFWPGSEAPIGGAHPRYWLPYEGGMAGTERVTRLLEWLDRPAADRPTFLTLYFSDVDAAGHRYGPESREVGRSIARVDGDLGRLVRGLATRGIEEAVNLVITSDHGMSPTSASRVIIVEDVLDMADVEAITDLDPTLAVAPRPGRENAVWARLAGAHARLRVYRRADTPPHWHYRDHPRIPAIVGVADEGWRVMRRESAAQFRASSNPEGGAHGYDPQVKSMQGLFVATGPAFPRGRVVPPFENVHVYAMLCRILGITPAPNDGDAAVAEGMMRLTPGD